MNFTSHFTLHTSHYTLHTSYFLLLTCGRDCSGNPFCGGVCQTAAQKDCSGKREMSAQKFAVKAGNFSVLVEIVVRVVLGVAVHKPHPDGQSDYACHRGHECAFQFVGHIVADVVEEK
jgi:hypothetical protein